MFRKPSNPIVCACSAGAIGVAAYVGVIAGVFAAFVAIVWLLSQLPEVHVTVPDWFKTAFMIVVGLVCVGVLTCIATALYGEYQYQRRFRDDTPKVPVTHRLQSMLTWIYRRYDGSQGRNAQFINISFAALVVVKTVMGTIETGSFVISLLGCLLYLAIFPMLLKDFAGFIWKRVAGIKGQLSEERQRALSLVVHIPLWINVVADFIPDSHYNAKTLIGLGSIALMAATLGYKYRCESEDGLKA